MAKNKVSFSRRLKQGMEIRGLKAADLSRLTGIDKSSISHYVNGHYEGKQDAVYLLSQALDVSEAWLMGFDVPMKRGVVPKQNAPAPAESFTPREVELVKAYRAQPSLQPAVDKLLGLSDAPPAPITHLVRDAAFDGDIRITVATSSPEEAAEAKRMDDYHSDGF